ncbi:MAG: 5'/3'-nucleotidase SurE [Chitinophagaceae bacterium]
MEKPTILITNDDGVTAPGIAALVEVAKQFGRVVVVAPDAPQSGMGHAITIGKPLRINPVHLFGDVEAYQCSGTPVDCVKLAVDKILHKKPDFCFSGINHGSNASINVIYSGTMSAAMEASIEHIPAVGFSYLDYSFDADFSIAQQVAHEMMHHLIKGDLPKHALYNVNIPKITSKQYKGLKICRQANAKWKESFVERIDPHGKKYYWLTGEFVNMDKGKDTDVWALDHHYASVVPVQYDLTDYKLLATLPKL